MNSLKKRILLGSMTVMAVGTIGGYAYVEHNNKVENEAHAAMIHKQELVDKEQARKQKEAQIKAVEKQKREQQQKLELKKKQDEEKKQTEAKNKEKARSLEALKAIAGKEDDQAVVDTDAQETPVEAEPVTDKVVESQGNDQQVQEQQQAAIQQEEIAKQEQEQSRAAKVNANRTDGFNFNGYHFDLEGWNGNGGEAVPQGTDKIYVWGYDPNQYLVERNSPAGEVIRSLGIGSQIVINGVTRTVYAQQSGLDNSVLGADGVSDAMRFGNSAEPGSIKIQTCDSADFEPTMTLWLAR